MRKHCHRCVRKYIAPAIDDSGLCPDCEAEALAKFRLPTAAEAIGIIFALLVMASVLFVLSVHKDWS